MPSRSTSFAQFYHEETKYSPDNIHKNSRQLDWDNQPIPFKEYPSDSKHIDLSAYVPLSTNPFSNTPLKRSSQWSDDEKPLAELSRLLYFSNGITAIVPYPPNPLLMRAAPSAGGLYPNEIYVLCRDYPEPIGSGLYNYQVKTHSLCEITPGDKVFEAVEKACFSHAALKNSKLALIVSAIFLRSSWRYQDRAYRRILLDSGFILGNIATVSHLYGHKAYAIGAFNDGHLNDILRFDGDEHSLFVVTFSELENCPNISLSEQPLALPSPVKAPTSRTVPPVGKRIEALHKLSDITAEPTPQAVSLIERSFKEYLEQPQDACIQSFLQSETLDCESINWEKCALMNTILKRRSTRRFDPDTAMTKKQLAQILQFAYNPQDYEEQNFDPKPATLCSELIKTYLIVNNVEGLEPGCYLYQPEQKSIKQIRFKELREESHYLCLGQELGRDASVLLFQTCDLEKAVKIFGERAYRYLHIDAGRIGEMLNLAAIKLNLGMSPIGGFFDDLVNEALGICPKDIVLLITCFGVPMEETEEIYG